MSNPKAEIDNQQSLTADEEDFLIEMFGPLNKDNDTFHDEIHW